MSLRLKIYLIGLIPLTCFFILGTVYLSDMYTIYQNASLIAKDMELSNTISSLIHEVQKERAASAGFINGALGLDKLEEQRFSTNKFFETLKSTFKDYEIDKDYQANLLNAQNFFESLREKIISKKLTAKDSTNEFIQIIAIYIQYHAEVAKISSFGEISSANLTLLEVESTKELAGQFRAHGMAIFSKDASITQEVLSLVQELIVGMKVKINSQTLNLSKQSIDFRSNFLKSGPWQKSLENFEKIKINYQTGKYGVETQDFYNNATAAIDLLDKVAKSQLGDTEATVIEKLNHIKNKMMINLSIFALIGFVITLLVIKTSRKLSNNLAHINKSMLEGIDSISNLSQGITKSSLSLAAAADEQAASVQETSASMNEIEAMIKRNDDDAQGSVEIAKKTVSELEKAVQSISQITKALGTITNSNSQLKSQIHESNEKFSNIATIIRQIGEKTNVINDIVFQTKLLSFNASVEAARAGEHGKGFAVVAEEVGNLAQMSGKASTEIYQMLESSIKTVETAVENQKNEINSLLANSESSIKSGVNLGSDLELFLTNLLPLIEDLKNRVDQISQASSEQLKGVSEVGIAIEQVNDAARNTSEISNESSNVAVELNTNLENFSQIVETLKKIVEG